MELFRCGEVTVSTIIEREGPQRRTEELFPTSVREVAVRHFREMEPFVYLPASGRIYNTYQSFVVRTPDLTIMIDTCVGENKLREPQFHAYPKKPWLDNLAADGLKPGDFDVVFNTHMHVDHVGWNTRLVEGRWVPNFINADYMFGREEYRYWERKVAEGWERPCRIWTDSCLPLHTAGRAKMIETDFVFRDDVWLTPSPGHTPGHYCVNVRAGRQRIVFVGDLMHHPIQCREPSWSTCFCEDPVLAAQTRRAFFEEVADTDVIVVPEHFAFPTAGRIRRLGDAFRYEFLNNWWK
jgi:glyoxylase-like metal-dependent hydrolase (beta-lactamase superfamily II)